jgi:sirohydrochlorin ferrochelatase
MKRAVLLLGHGSKAEDANAGMYEVIQRIRETTKYDLVEAGFLELNSPSIPEAIDICVEKGAGEVVVIPYFLHMGRHVIEDLPKEIEKGKKKHPNVSVLLGPPLGFHKKLVEIVLERVGEASPVGTS